MTVKRWHRVDMGSMVEDPNPSKSWMSGSANGQVDDIMFRCFSIPLEKLHMFNDVHTCSTSMRCPSSKSSNRPLKTALFQKPLPSYLPRLQLSPIPRGKPQMLKNAWSSSLSSSSSSSSSQSKTPATS